METHRDDGGASEPRKASLKGTIPAFVKRRVASPEGIREAEGTLR
jgi:hypothetical protein